jgi:hypothetical protein
MAKYLPISQLAWSGNMLIRSLFQGILKETKERFDEHKDERSEKAKLIEQQVRIIEANDPNLIERRIARVIGAQGAGTQPTQRGLERVKGTNDLMSIRFFEDGIRKAKAAARVDIRA